jgi:hypothetical protein
VYIRHNRLSGGRHGTHTRLTATKAFLSRLFRDHVRTQLYDDSGTTARGIAIYSLSDPRDIRNVRYVGQTGAPGRRFFQHLNAAKLWLPEEMPWWMAHPKMRPLSEWIRALYRDECRLPTMLINEWVRSVTHARVAERRRIHECLEQRLVLLNVEMENLGPQFPLI